MKKRKKILQIASLLLIFTFLLTILAPVTQVQAATSYTYSNEFPLTLNDSCNPQNPHTQTRRWYTDSEKDVAWFKISKTKYCGIAKFNLTGSDQYGYIQLFDSNKKALTDAAANYTAFALDANKSYYVKVTGVKGNAEMTLTSWKASTKYSNNSKNTAKSLKDDNYMTGLDYEPYINSTDANWYKFSISKKQRFDIVMSNFMFTGKYRINLIDANGKTIKSVNYQTDGDCKSVPHEAFTVAQGKKSCWNLKEVINNISLAKGTYYIKVEALSTKTNGFLKVGYATA